MVPQLPLAPCNLRHLHLNSERRTRLIATAISALNKVNGKRAIATLCIGGGQAIAYEIKRD